MLYDQDMNESGSMQNEVNLPPDLMRRVRKIAVELRCPPVEVIRMAIRKGLSDIGENKKRAAVNSAITRPNKKP